METAPQINPRDTSPSSLYSDVPRGHSDSSGKSPDTTPPSQPSPTVVSTLQSLSMPPHGITNALPEEVSTGVKDAILHITDHLILTDDERTKILTNLPTVIRSETDTSYWRASDHVIAIHDTQRDSSTYYHEATHFIRDMLMPKDLDERQTPELVAKCVIARKLNRWWCLADRATKKTAQEICFRALDESRRTQSLAHEFLSILMEGLSFGDTTSNAHSMPEPAPNSGDQKPVAASGSPIQDYEARVLRAAKLNGQLHFLLKTSHDPASLDPFQEAQMLIEDALKLFDQQHVKEREITLGSWAKRYKAVISTINKIMVKTDEDYGRDIPAPNLASAFYHLEKAAQILLEAKRTDSWSNERKSAIQEVAASCLEELETAISATSALLQDLKSSERTKRVYSLPRMGAFLHSNLLKQENREILTRLMRTPSYAIVDKYLNPHKHHDLDLLKSKCDYLRAMGRAGLLESD